MGKEKSLGKTVSHSQDSWARKMEAIKERDKAMRRRAENQLIRFEMDAQDKVGHGQAEVQELRDWARTFDFNAKGFRFGSNQRDC